MEKVPEHHKGFRGMGIDQVPEFSQSIRGGSGGDGNTRFAKNSTFGKVEVRNKKHAWIRQPESPSGEGNELKSCVRDHIPTKFP